MTRLIALAALILAAGSGWFGDAFGAALGAGVGAGLGAGLGAALGAAGPAGAATSGPRVDIVKVSGLIDPINADLLASSLRHAAGERATLLVWQLNSTGGTVSQRRIDTLTAAMAQSQVPVAVWVGGSGRPRAFGEAFTLFLAADTRGEAAGSRIGGGRSPGAPSPLEHRRMAADDAVDQHLVTADQAPTIVDFLGDLSGQTIKGVRINLGRPGSGGGFSKDVQFEFSQLSIVPKLLHTAASPDVAFVMLLIAVALVIFEFFTAGVGVAAGTGIVFGLLSCYGLGVLPTHWWAVVLLGLSALGFAIDVQAGAPRFWTVVGVGAYAVGALTLYHGQAVSLWVVVGMGLLFALLMVSGMPAMVRTRFSTPTIGRESLVGTMGVALSGVSPEGTVQINGAPWRARTNRATPIPAGDPVRVVAIDGLLLEVEPQTGGAREAHH